ARPRSRADRARPGARLPADVHGDAPAPGDRHGARAREAVLGARGVSAAVERVLVGHLYPSYLNIYADRGNIAVLAARAAWRGLELDVRTIAPGEPTPGGVDLLYVGGGQDREQALIAPDLAS